MLRLAGCTHIEECVGTQEDPRGNVIHPGRELLTLEAAQVDLLAPPAPIGILCTARGSFAFGFSSNVRKATALSFRKQSPMQLARYCIQTS